MLNEVNNLTNGVNPESIMIDFESTMLGARERVYPLVQKKKRVCSFNKKYLQKSSGIWLMPRILEQRAVQK